MEKGLEENKTDLEEMEEATEIIEDETAEISDENLEEAETDTEEDEEASLKEKKGLFGKKKEKKDIKIEELTDRLQRQMAEFDNYRKRTEKEKAAMYEIGSRSVIEKMLPIIDNFERGLATMPEDQACGAFMEGMEMVYKQFLETLEEIDVKPIEAIGKEFDPNLHNAVMHIEDEEYGENIVVEEFQKGYLYKETVVRFSMVKVAN